MRFSPISFWMEGVARTQPTLEGKIRVDAVVIGGGFTGLSTAIALAERGLSVALLERDIIGAGASGRNCGQVGADIGKNLGALSGDIGRENAVHATRLLRRAIDHVGEFVDRHGIDCDYRRTGNVFAGVHPGQQKTVERVASAATAFSLPIERLSSRDIQALGISETVACGFRDMTGGTLDPGKLVRGMRDVAARHKSIALYEHSPVIGIDRGLTVTVRTPSGSVESPYCIVATNAYSCDLGLLENKIFPVSVSVAVTRRLTSSERKKLAWKDVDGLYTAHHVLENLRLTADGRLLVGTKYVRRGFDGTLPPPNDRNTFAILRETLRDRFPALAGLEFEYGWTGRVAVTTDNVPIIGTLGDHRNIFYSAGYSGHGIAMASYAGHFLSALLSNEPLGDAEVLRRKPRLPLPPEPLRWMATGMLFGLWHFLDRHTDRSVKRSRARLRD